MQMIKLGMVGAGIVGERIIKQIEQEQSVTLLGVYDEQKERLSYLNETYGVPIAESMDELFHSGIDWLYIGTPPASHAEIAIQAARAGLHIFSEKPLAHDAEGGLQMTIAADENQVQTAMHFPLMYKDSVREMVIRIKNGSIGNVVRVEFEGLFPEWPRPWQKNPWIASREQGGFIREVFPHYLQLIYRMFGDLTLTNHQVTYPEQQDLCETGVIAYGRTNAGIPLHLSGLSGIGQKESLQLNVYGDKGVLTLENWSDLYVSEKNQERVKVTEISAVPSIFEEMNELSTLLVPFEEGLIVQRLVDQLLAE